MRVLAALAQSAANAHADDGDVSSSALLAGIVAAFFCAVALTGAVAVCGICDPPDPPQPPPPVTGGPRRPSHPPHAMLPGHPHGGAAVPTPGKPPRPWQQDPGHGPPNPEHVHPHYPGPSNHQPYGPSNSIDVYTVGGFGPGSADIMLTGKTVKETVDLLHRICDQLECRIQSDYTILRSTIRPGMHAAIANVEATFGGEVTVAFFPEAMRKKRHMKMYDNPSMKDIMPVVTEQKDEVIHNDARGSVVLPPHIFFEKCITLRTFLRRLPEKEHQGELLVLLRQIAKVVDAAHKRQTVLRDINADNIVRANVGTQISWTLFEFSSWTRPGAKTERIAMRCAPPEMSDALLQSEPVTFQLSYDMWQLGLLLYEVAQGEPYWPANMQDARILHTLASREARLPHETRPLRTPEAHQMLVDLLKRNPAERMNAADFWKRLEHFNTREHTLNPGSIVPTNKDVVLDD